MPTTSLVIPKPSLFPRKLQNVSFTCKASSSSSSSSSLLDFDLYGLLGIDSSSNQTQIKTAYRSLQKRCHPDIAGPAGHNMAIILNEAYSVLSNPTARSSCDKCVGCLKCALFAEKTFAIESTYGRARVVAQWADPEHKIQEAIRSCPVDCISIVERSKLVALEFLMSKQPRGNVRVGARNTVEARVSNISDDFKKF
ncbi:hypothetical protein SLEP1_g4807 [Rubroshorea leprosula]|uniref:J domain-containing protein n=1 Tax=Rubroshorea leprosula TaxID=152421 RepID=A0AAV5HPX1_9ROSI|nr:hypothetical protein SLEP1_g4807 [Rubroshorea leprosula]